MPPMTPAADPAETSAVFRLNHPARCRWQPGSDGVRPWSSRATGPSRRDPVQASQPTGHRSAPNTGPSPNIAHQRARRAIVALVSSSHSCTVSGLVITTVVLIAPLKVSHTRPALPKPCRVTITVLGSLSGVRPHIVPRNVSSEVLPLIAVHHPTPRATALAAPVRWSRYRSWGHPTEASGRRPP